MIRTALAPLFALALAGTAQAYSPIGGGSATITGGGDDLAVTYSAGGAGGGGMATHSQSGRLARFAGGHGDGQLVEYLAPAPANPGPSARLVGGGDNTEVVYDRR